MAIKKALYGRQPGCFSLCPLAVTRDCFLSLVPGVLIKCQVYPFWFEKVVISIRRFYSCTESVHGLIFHSYSVTSNEMRFLL